MSIFLIDELKTTLTKHKVERLTEIAVKNNHSVKEIIDVSFYEDVQIAFRAAWVLEHIYTNYPDQFLPHTAYFLEKLPTQNNLSARRHYAKIFALITGKKDSAEMKTVIANYPLEKLIETVFNWLITKTPVAIKSHCLQILANLAPRYPWIKDELMQTIDYLEDKESIAFFAKVKQIKKQLKKTH